MPVIAAVCWGALGLIHLLPALALFRSSMISKRMARANSKG
jgi:hypothetical protein